MSNYFRTVIFENDPCDMLASFFSETFQSNKMNGILNWSNFILKFI